MKRFVVLLSCLFSAFCAFGEDATIPSVESDKPELFCISPSRYRGMVSTARRFPCVKFGVTYSPKDGVADGAVVRFSVADGAGREVSAAEVPAVAGDSLAEVPVPQDLPAGDYAVRAQLVRKSRTVAKSETTLRIIGEMPGLVVFDEDMTMLCDGRPFFPLGIYHIAGTNSYTGDIGTIVDMGFNTLNVFSWAGCEVVRTLRMHDAKCLWEPLPHRTKESCAAHGTEFESNPGALLHYTVDEPGEKQYPWVKELHEAWHAHDIAHPTVVVSYRPDQFVKNVQLSDVLMPDNYPYWPPKAEDVSSIARFMETARTACADRQPYLFVPQAFGHEPVGVWRTMSLMGVVHGAKGLIWYAWNEKKGKGFRFNKELMADAPRFIAQLKLVAPALMNAEKPPRGFVEADNALHGMVAFDTASELKWLILANPTTNDLSVSVDVPEMAGSGLKRLDGAFDSNALAVEGESTVKVELPKLTSGIWAWGAKMPEIGPLAIDEEFKVPAKLPKRRSGRTLKVVADGGRGAYTNIQDAVDAARPGDVVEVAAGVYGPFKSPNKFIDIVGEGHGNSIIDANGLCRALTLTRKPFGDMSAETNTLVSGFTIRGGSAESDSFRPLYGGGALGGTLVDCEVTGNAAPYGGGMAYGRAVDVRFEANKAAKAGGAAALTVADGCDAVGNESQWDGGAFHFVKATLCHLSKNTAVRHGGATHYGENISCRIVGNRAGAKGGGSAWSHSTRTLYVGNDAAGEGGGFFSGRIAHCTFVRNGASRGGGGAGVECGGWGAPGGCSASVFEGNVARDDDATSIALRVGGGNFCKTANTNAVPRGFKNVEDFGFMAEGSFVPSPTSPLLNVKGGKSPDCVCDANGEPAVCGASMDAGAFELSSSATVIDEYFASRGKCIAPRCRFVSVAVPANVGRGDDGTLILDGSSSLGLSDKTDHATGEASLAACGIESDWWTADQVQAEFLSDKQGGALFEIAGVRAEVDPANGRLRVIVPYGYDPTGLVGNSMAAMGDIVFETPKSVVGDWHKLVVKSRRVRAESEPIATVSLDGVSVPVLGNLSVDAPVPVKASPKITIASAPNHPRFQGSLRHIRYILQKE